MRWEWPIAAKRHLWRSASHGPQRQRERGSRVDGHDHDLNQHYAGRFLFIGWGVGVRERGHGRGLGLGYRSHRRHAGGPGHGRNDLGGHHALRRRDAFGHGGGRHGRRLELEQRRGWTRPLAVPPSGSSRRRAARSLRRSSSRHL